MSDERFDKLLRYAAIMDGRYSLESQEVYFDLALVHLTDEQLNRVRSNVQLFIDATYQSDKTDDVHRVMNHRAVRYMDGTKPDLISWAEVDQWIRNWQAFRRAN